MNLVIRSIILLYAVYRCNAGYGIPAQPSNIYGAQSDVRAPSYVPSYLRHGYGSYAGTNGAGSGSYGGVNTYSGIKTQYTGTKSGYAGVKSGYAGSGYGYYPVTSNNIPNQEVPYGQPNMAYVVPRPGSSGGHSGYAFNSHWESNSGNAPTLNEFVNNAHQPYAPRCEHECQNGGICVDTNTCHCPVTHTGRYCESEKKICRSYPPTPMNSNKVCSGDTCTIKCMAGHKFSDGSTAANLKCVEGEWKPTRPELKALSNCQPQCEPPCGNGGVCLSVNVCQCPRAFKGPQCQYPATVCDIRKLAFNGAYNCSGNDEHFACTLTCPPGASFSHAAVDRYICQYSIGVFQPQPIPHCVFNDVIIITPSSNMDLGNAFYETGHGYGGHARPHPGAHTNIVIQDYTPKAGTCLSWAGTHYKTFDGTIYSFKSNCQHILLRDARDHKFSVTVKHGDCARRSYCPTELTVYVEEKPYVLYASDDGTVVFRSTKRMIPIPATLPGIRVEMPSDHVLVHLDGLGVNVKWDTNNMILVEASVLLWNNTEGLCGTLDGHVENELRTKEGAMAQTKNVMASSWQVNKIGDLCDGSPSETSACASKSSEEVKRAQKFCSEIFSKDKFRKCSKFMDVSLLLQACQWDYCGCLSSENPEDCACSTVSVYAKECLKHDVGEMRSWRDASTCPMKCPDGKLYHSCGPDTQASCAFPNMPTSSNASCVEGCFCPQGLLLEGGKCIPKNECPCRLRNKVFQPGSTVTKDCNTCKCELGAWTCTAAACGARCGAVGDPHYTTFDGRKYNFMGHCTYTLLATENITMEVENVACSGTISEAMNLTPYQGTGKPSCTKAVSLNYNGATIHLKQGGLILVNGKEVTTLPVQVGDILIRPASSLFLIVQLPIGVDLWWDGNTRVFVDIPAGFKDKTKGLCGTFNLNQADDFLTPEGDVEQTALAFANKWKTREFCEDTDITEPEHPCKANVQNKQTAETYCSKLRSKLFEACHWYVDVEPYVEECVYDMCACAGDASRCLCPILGDYAMACAKAGVHIQWRYNVRECELQCTGGQEYTVCADSCQRSCADVALASQAQARCRPACVEGCACAPGQVLDSNNVCVPIGRCPCFHKGVQFNAGYKEVRPGRRERELCTCVGARWDCKPATPDEIQNYPPAEDLMSNCSAANHMEFTACETAEPLTCKNMHLPQSTVRSECRPGCQCRAGYVLEAAARRCVPAAQCPCHHGGRSYADGHVMQEECNTCECKNGNWTCTSKACAGTCAAWGDSHVVTFDGADYDFEGVCTYLLAKGVADTTDGFDVEIQNVPCGTTGATCSKSVTLKVGSGANEETVQLTKNAPLPDISQLKRIKLRLAGAFVFLDVPSLGVTLQWDRAMRVYVKVDVMWKNRVKGLCGNYNSDMRDDFQTPSGGGIAETSPLIFADSWKLKPTCPNAQAVVDHCKQRPERAEWAVSACGALKRHPFSLCHGEVAPAAWVARCERDACACDAGEDCACACAALAAYADACAARGVSFKWRAQERCPMQCDEECSNYDDCVSACPLETCDNTLYYDDLKTMCDKSACVEGCKPKKSCPDGQVYKNSSFTECVPRIKCSPPCMTLPDGRELLEGDVIEEDDCHTCRCSKKQRVCTGQPCTTPTEPLRHDEPLKCVSGWTEWVDADAPHADDHGASVEIEPLPKLNQLQIGSSMCTPEMMKGIECRTVVNHETPKQTGLNVECSLERGLFCQETSKQCPNFEIRVLCQCEEASTLPPTEGSPTEPSVTESIHPHNRTTPTTPTTPPTPTTPSLCPPGRLYDECAFPCNNLCDHFKKTLQAKGKCLPNQNCADGCVDKTCLSGSVWRDDNTCVPAKDCTCFYEGKVIKPGGVVTDGCKKCQCLNNELHCDTSDCNTSTALPIMSGPTHAAIVSEPAHQVKETTLSPFLIKSTVSPPPECNPEGYTYLLSDEPLPSSSFTASSIAGPEFEPKNIVLNPAPAATADEPFQCLNSDHPNYPHPWDCSKFYECTPDILNTRKPHTVLKQCSPGLMYNPQTMVCDWPNSVTVVRPECAFGGIITTPAPASDGSWKPLTKDQNQYIQVELPHLEPLYGVIMKGHPTLDQYVTSYEVMYGDDGHIFHTVDDRNGQPQVFRGPVDHKQPVKQMFEPPIEAKFVRIRPLTWHDDIALKFELIGCREPATTIITTVEPIQCMEPLGIAAELPIELIEVSSNDDGREDFKLDGDKGWKAAYSTPGEWIMFNFQSPRNITGIKTKGGPTGWVTTYNILYTTDLSTFNPVMDDTGAYKMFPGNFDGDSVVMNEFRPPLYAQYLKVLPLKWKDAIEMRIEPIGCYEPYLVVSTTSTETPMGRSPCAACPGVPETSEACACAAPLLYDGQRCVPRELCPCLHKSTPYVVGSTFRGTNCEECICKLGGVSDCKPVTECKCAPDLVPKLSTPSCECLCEPCANGTKICPTSKLCLPLERWCNGLLDCPDDEKDCEEPTTVFEPLVVTTVRPTVAVTPATTLAPTTVKPDECPKVECPSGYIITHTSATPSNYYSSSGDDLPPPKPRNSYQRYQRARGGYGGYGGGFSKGGYSKGGYKGFSKGGHSSGGYNGPSKNQAFTLNKPSLESSSHGSGPAAVQRCAAFSCRPALPPLPPPRPGVTRAPPACSAPACPPAYTLKLDNTKTLDECPQYVCVPPPELPVFCNVTGRTISTFDGTEYKYDVCHHILARENRLDAWTVLVRKLCSADGCLNELILRQDDQLILVKPTLKIEYEKFEYTVEQTNKICFQKNSFNLHKIGNGLSITSRKYNFSVIYSPDGDIKIGVPKAAKGSVDGLCGAFDGDASNDRRLPDGTPAVNLQQFGQSWGKPGLSPSACKVKVVPPQEKERVLKECDVVKKAPFNQCARVLNLDKWRTICMEKIPECKDKSVNGTKRTEQECRCSLLEQLAAECLATDKNIDLASWRIQNDCPAVCPLPLVHSDCYRGACEPSCARGALAARACPALPGHCFPGCYCPAGTLRRGDDCIPPADCMDCVCDGSNSPTKYVTFERDDIPFNGNCTYLVSRDRNETGYHKYQVFATNGPCEDNPDSICTQKVHLLYENHVIQISKDSGTKKLLTMVDKALVFKYPMETPWAIITLVKGQDVTVLVPDANMELSVTQNKLEFSVWVPSHVYANRTEGLCGVCAGRLLGLLVSNNTLTQDINEFVTSWQAPAEALEKLEAASCSPTPPAPEPTCVEPPPEQNPCYNILNVDKFGPCHALVEPQPFVETCTAELCDNATDACAPLERYAAECRRQGVCLAWRTDLCPYPCEAPLVYRSCVDCERTCDNNDELTSDPEKCDQQPVEGCFCPEGKVRVNNTCIEPDKCFPCDADNVHFAGDEWQVNACVRCTCSRGEAGAGPRAHVACTEQRCSQPACDVTEDMITSPAKPGQCCPEYTCMKKPQKLHCEEPKKMECGFGQVLKQKTGASGCTEFSCECKPESECEAIPSTVEDLEPGVVRQVDRSGCCPRAELVCRADTCPPPAPCDQFRQLTAENVTGKCCPEYKCELPKDKCLVQLEWEAAPKGGEKARATPEVMLKDMESVWLDGPCRSCSCAASGPQCSVTECPAVVSTQDFVMEPRPVPFNCCPEQIHVACRDGDNIYKVGENWTSPYDVCESYQCVRNDNNKLRKVTTRQRCEQDCQQGWEYEPAPQGSDKCCGSCKPVACVCQGVEHPIGDKWTSADFCTNYTCLNLNGTLQVQTANETCVVPRSSQYLYKEKKVPGKCCSEFETVACRVGDKIYEVGQNWTSTTDPCVSYQCKNEDGKIQKLTTQHFCDTECQIGSEYVEAAAGSGKCCGECKPVACVVGGSERRAGDTWTSADFCTTYTCDRLNDTFQVQGSNETCPKISEEVKKQFVYKETKLPGKCCSINEPIACLVDDKVYEVGVNWTSTSNPCESYRCVNNSGKLEKLITVQGCDKDCQQGWEYEPAPQGSDKCCGSCKPVACVCQGVEHLIGEKWTSADFCTKYTCLNLNGTLQVQSSNETCPEISTELRKQFLYKEIKVLGECCAKNEPIACILNDKVYEVGVNWTSTSNPCESYQCVNNSGKLEKFTTVQGCDKDCQQGWEYEPAPQGSDKCCGSCKPVACVVQGAEHPIGDKWTSADFCTKYTCLNLNGTLQVQSSNETCPEISTELRKQFLYKEIKVLGECCAKNEPIACILNDKVYEVGVNWTSTSNPCESYQCVNNSGKLEKFTTVQGCDKDCQQGWEYEPAPQGSDKCCGSCKPVACVCQGVEHLIGDKWTSADFCTNYTCLNLNGTLQVQTSNETCPVVPEAMRKQFVYQEVVVPGKCCKSEEPVACRDGNDIYQEGQTWQSDEPCRNWTCERDAGGRISRGFALQTCEKNCTKGFGYKEPPPGTCCGHCEQTACIANDGELRAPGSTWMSDDNCTTYSCDQDGESLCVSAASASCPSLKDCAPENLYNDTCCTRCRVTSGALSRCVPEAVPRAATVGLVRLRTRFGVLCLNKQPIIGFRECRGSCDSGTHYNNQTGGHDTRCECCSALRHEPLSVQLVCENGATYEHRVASPAACACRACADLASTNAGYTKTGRSSYAGTKNAPRRNTDDGYNIPQMFARFGGTSVKPQR